MKTLFALFFGMCYTYSLLYFAAAEPPSNITANRDPPNDTLITVTWTEPATVARPTIYIIHYEADGHQSSQSVHFDLPDEWPMTILYVKPEIMVYAITMVTLSSSAMLPSIPSSPVVYSKLIIIM